MLASVAPRANQDSTDRLGHTFDGSCGSEQRVHAVEKRSPTRREPSRGGLRPQYLVQPTFEPARLPRPNDCMVPVSVNTAATRYRLQSLHSCRPMPVGQVKTGCGRSFREGEWRWPPGPVVQSLPGRMAAVPRKLPHAVLSMSADDVSTKPAAMSALCSCLMAVPTQRSFSPPARRDSKADTGGVRAVDGTARPKTGNPPEHCTWAGCRVNPGGSVEGAGGPLRTKR